MGKKELVEKEYMLDVIKDLVQIIMRQNDLHTMLSISEQLEKYDFGKRVIKESGLKEDIENEIELMEWNLKFFKEG